LPSSLPRAPSPHRYASVRQYVDAWSIGFAALSLVLWYTAVHQANFARMGPLGLVTVLGWTYFVGLALVVAGLAVELLRTPVRASRTVVMLIVLAVFLFGTASAVEPTASLADSWLHAGFTQYIVQHGHVLNNFDARFSWPGGFSLAAVLVAFSGQANALAMLRWFPLVMELLYMAPLLVIAKFADVSRRAGYLGVALFYAANWIHQDYFSPQALNYLFYLVVLAAVFAAWQSGPRERLVSGASDLRSRLALSLRVATHRRIAGEDAIPTWNARTTLWIFGLLTIIIAASAMSHQLTPYALMLSLGACLVSRRLARPELVLIVALFAVGWLSVGASNYWMGHLHDIFGGIGQISNTLGSNVANRVTGSASHRLIVDVRILIIVVLYVLAGIGALRRAASSRTLELLVAAPFVLLAVQNYGGEGLLRVVLFALPFSSLLAASAILPRRRGAIAAWVGAPRRTSRHRVLLGLLGGVVILGFSLGTTVVRGGNDSYEAFSRGELAAVNYTYDHVLHGQVMGMVAPYLPVGQKPAGSVDLFIVAGSSTPRLSELGAVFLKQRPAWVVLSQSQEAWGEIVGGYPKGWIKSLQASLIDHGYRIAASWSTATVLHLRGA